MDRFSPQWWIAAGQRAAYTALAAVLPIAAQFVTGEVPFKFMYGVVLASMLLSFLTSLARLPEITGASGPVVWVVINRVARTVGQVGLASLGGLALIQDVDWGTFAQTVGGAALVTLVRGFMTYLPESDATQAVVAGTVVDPVPTPVSPVAPQVDEVDPALVAPEGPPNGI